VRQRKGFLAGFCEIKEIARTSVRYGFQNKQVWLLISIMGISVFAFQSFNMLWSPFYEEKLGRSYVSLVWFGCAIFSLAGNFLAGWAGKGAWSEKTILFFSTIVILVFSLPMTLCENGWLSLMFFWLHEFGRGIFTPTHSAYLQDHIPSDRRATIGSFNSMIGRFGAAIGWLLSGFLGDYIAIPQNWQISILFFIFSIPLILKLQNGGKKV